MILALKLDQLNRAHTIRVCFARLDELQPFSHDQDPAELLEGLELLAMLSRLTADEEALRGIATTAARIAGYLPQVEEDNDNGNP